MYKIGFIGVHSGGKTTTLYGMAHILKAAEQNVELVAEAAREAATRGFKINRLTTIQTQLWLIGRQFCKEQEASLSKPDFILTDRTVFDSIVYTMSNDLGTDPLNIDALLSIATTYEKLANYDLLLYFAPFDHITDDKVRDTDNDWQQRVNNNWHYIIDRGYIKTEVVTVDGTDRHQRLNFVENLIADYYGK